MARPTLVLFDLDETLFDHRHASRSGLEVLRRKHGALASRPLVELEDEAHRILERIHRRVLDGELAQGEGRIERFRLLFEWCGEKLGADGLAAVVGEYRSAYRAARRHVAGAADLLIELRRVARIGIVTNNFTREQESKLEHCGLTDLIDFMVTSEEAGCAKPEPAIFRSALERGGVSAADAVMVGDSWEVDVVGAQSSGIRPIWFNPRREPSPAGPVDELHAFEPVETACRVILDGGDGR